MRPRTSSLNPYAASYVPISELSRQQSKTSMNHNSQHIEENLPSEFFSKTNCFSKDPYGSSSQTQNEMTEKHSLDDDFELDLAYLRMTFPCVSEDFLIEVYMVNKSDMAATVEMLNQLESLDDDCSNNLPDTLDIGDISEPGPSADCAASNSNKVAGGEASSSSASRIEAPSPDRL